MRHAKSSWDSPTLSDHDRPLNARGERSAHALGDWLRKINILPDQALVSDAARTQATMAGLCLSVRPDLSGRLYHASPDILFETLRAASGSCVLMLAHNPGIAELAGLLVTEEPDHPRFYDYPTGATLVADFAIDRWTDLKIKSGQPKVFVTPRELVA